ncbi:YARHG domain-containing protein, partial [Clostridioides difficile]|nr:YARHG domain-containing protein [Clostridioides difficile]
YIVCVIFCFAVYHKLFKVTYIGKGAFTRELISCMLCGFVLMFVVTAIPLKLLDMVGLYHPKEDEVKNVNNTQVEESYNHQNSNDYNEDIESNNTENTISNTEEYIISDSNSRYLTEDELNSYNKSDLALIRNEIFARYGYIFQNEEYRNYFSKKSWYSPKEGISAETSILSEVEKSNVELIKDLESN